MSVRRQSNSKGDAVARELKEKLISDIRSKTGIELPAHQTLDQLVRNAVKSGVSIGFYCFKS